MGFQDSFGWSSGPILDSNFAYTFDLYARVDEEEEEEDNSRNTKQGRLVGQVHVDYDGLRAVVSVETAGPYYLDEVHGHIGTSRLPTRNGEEIADEDDFPVSQIDLEAMQTSSSFVVSGFDYDGIHVVVQATVCGDYTAPAMFQEPEIRGFRGVGTSSSTSTTKESRAATSFTGIWSRFRYS